MLLSKMNASMLIVVVMCLGCVHSFNLQESVDEVVDFVSEEGKALFETAVGFVSSLDIHSLKADTPAAPTGENCEVANMRGMGKFDMQKFAGNWFELAKTVPGHIDTDDGMWKITAQNSSNNNQFKFLYSGRAKDLNCIRPVSGSILPSMITPGEMTFTYRTYSTNVGETIRVLFTDYDTVAAIYACRHTMGSTGKCHPAGVYAAVWTRRSHVDLKVYEEAVTELEKACIDKKSIHIRSVKGPCNVEELGTRDDLLLGPDICFQNLEPGSCQGSLQRYYYDNKDKKCLSFEYTGCGGNDNRFLTLTECENKCKGDAMTSPLCTEIAKCALACPPCCREHDNGCLECDCEHIVIEDFLNCLSSPSLCPSVCAAQEMHKGCYVCLCDDIDNDQPGVCLEIKDKGTCRGREHRFYYNAVSGNCEMFNYTGCGGNKNNFVSRDKCQLKCLAVRGIVGRADPVETDPDDNSATAINLHLFYLFVTLFPLMLLR